MKKYKMTIDLRILELLGPNLYTNIYYVLAELIANAYDADAHNVYIISNKDDIRVEDDGHGMSYKAGEVEKYLNVAVVSRHSPADSLTKSGSRCKMGRKGVGKLAALSVSDNVDVLTISDGEKSGFVLSRRPEKDNMLKAIDDNKIEFQKIEQHGSAIVMRNPRYRLHSAINAIAKNILKLFPLICNDFKVHIIRGEETATIDSYDRNIMSELCALITLGDEFKELNSLVPDSFPDKREDLVISLPEKNIPVVINDNDGIEGEYTLTVKGWIGAYKSTRNRKLEITDFPDNFISIFANKKMGEFNILPAIGQNKLNEVYIVGQIHADLFELSELPDMALSNRQGYKSDDPRYTKLLDYVRKELLIDILKRRDTYSDLIKKQKKLQNLELQKHYETELKRSFDNFRKKASSEAAIALSKDVSNLSKSTIEERILKSINMNSPDIGLKALVDSQKKKILISQTLADKPLADIVFEMLLYNSVPPEDILFTNCDNEVCRVPEGMHVYDYLREFFVESYSSQKIFVLFVTSENTKRSWGAITEVGAAWITQIDHRIFTIAPFRPEHPLDDAQQWHTTNRTDSANGELSMSSLNADIFCQKIEAICDRLGYDKKQRASNRGHLGTLVRVN